MSKASMWGKDLDDMTRDELIAAVEYLLAQMADHFSSDNIRARALGRVEMIKRGAVQ